MIHLLVAGVLAQGLDAVTMRPELEANALVVALGPTAYLAKIALILGVVALAWSLPRLPAARPMSLRAARAASASLTLLLLVVGLVGAVSNLLASALS